LRDTLELRRARTAIDHLQTDCKVISYGEVQHSVITMTFQMRFCNMMTKKCRVQVQSV